MNVDVASKEELKDIIDRIKVPNIGRLPTKITNNNVVEVKKFARELLMISIRSLQIYSRLLEIDNRLETDEKSSIASGRDEIIRGFSVFEDESEDDLWFIGKSNYFKLSEVLRQTIQAFTELEKLLNNHRKYGSMVRDVLLVLRSTKRKAESVASEIDVPLHLRQGLRK